MPRADEDGPPDRMGLTVFQRCDASLRSEICGMIDCSVPPEQICHDCRMWYCAREFEIHFVRYPDHRNVRR